MSLAKRKVTSAEGCHVTIESAAAFRLPSQCLEGEAAAVVLAVDEP
jgi:hypothetical protein